MFSSASLLIAIAAVFGTPTSDPACSPAELVIRPDYTIEFGFERGSGKLSQEQLKKIETWTEDLKRFAKDTVEIVGYVG